MTLPALYQIADQYLADLAKLDDLDMPPEVIEDTLESLGGELQEKFIAVASYIRNMEVIREAKANAAWEMDRQVKAMDNRIKRMREYLKYNMKRTNTQKIDSPYLRITRQNVAQSVEILAGGSVPQEFMRYPEPPPPSPDKIAIRDYLKENGDQSWAKLVQDETVVIK